MKTLRQPSTTKNLSNLNRKCGDITYCIQVGKRVYALNCLYCPQICLQWDIFINHMEEEHNEDLNFALQHQSLETEPQIDNVQDEISEDLQRNKTTPTTFNKLEEPNRFPFNDPLEGDNSTNAMSLESSIKIEKIDCTPIQTMIDDDDFQYDKSEDDKNDEETSEEGYDWSELNDDISLQSSSSCNNDNNDDHKNFVFNKIKLTEIIIKYYKNYPVLWQTNRNEHTNVIKQQEAYKKITKVINKEMNLNFKCIQIKGKINKLRSKFRKEHELLTAFTEEIDTNSNESDMECNEFYTTPNGPRTVSWLYEKMSFLKDHINNGKKRSKRGTKALMNDKNYLPLAKFSFEENQQFVELYKSYPCLWDVNHIGFRFKNLRQESLQELLEAVNNEMNLKISLKELQKKLYIIRYAITQEKHRKIESEKIKAVFTPQCKLYNELLFLKDSVGPFKCEYCDQIFNGPDQYKVHKSSHDGSMPYTCPQCKKGFMKVGNCTVHLRRHTKDYQFECQECGKKFPTSTDLNVHSRHHTGEKPYFCDICGQSFRTWTYFDSHRRRHEKNPNHKCSLCSKGFYEHNKLKQHMKSHMNVRDKVCDDCGKSFTCTKYLNQHKLTHAEKKKYSCKICGKMFAQRGALSNHTKSHGIITKL
ncbi:zinc finger protein 502-like isoform X1 [Calliphora vicina]|uniref:zinc finger protein 502-like isoform X1 n=1 Tax=Calliphora vicina TaxID=7373 RepID=UPI00325C1826